MSCCCSSCCGKVVVVAGCVGEWGTYECDRLCVLCLPEADFFPVASIILDRQRSFKCHSQQRKRRNSLQHPFWTDPLWSHSHGDLVIHSA